MTYSMTAYARVKEQIGQHVFCWEIKSVNHRFLEMSFRLPENFRFMEMALRKKLQQQLSRGKVDCSLKYESISTEESLALDESLIQSILKRAEELSSQYRLANDLSLSAMLQWPGVLKTVVSEDAAAEETAHHVFEQALDRLLSQRASEGQALKQQIIKRLDKLESEHEKATALAGDLSHQIRDKIQQRVKEINCEINEHRLEQEVALLATRLDVNEELDRLKTHIDETRAILKEEKPVGRRLDFYMQELHREANTLSSKSDSAKLSSIAVEMKVLIEQMREQIQNIE